jgi:hypothetical protein
LEDFLSFLRKYTPGKKVKQGKKGLKAKKKPPGGGYLESVYKVRKDERQPD